MAEAGQIRPVVVAPTSCCARCPHADVAERTTPANRHGRRQDLEKCEDVPHALTLFQVSLSASVTRGSSVFHKSLKRGQRAPVAFPVVRLLPKKVIHYTKPSGRSSGRRSLAGDRLRCLCIATAGRQYGLAARPAAEAERRARSQELPQRAPLCANVRRPCRTDIWRVVRPSRLLPYIKYVSGKGREPLSVTIFVHLHAHTHSSACRHMSTTTRTRMDTQTAERTCKHIAHRSTDALVHARART